VRIGIIGYSGAVSLPHVKRLEPLISILIPQLVDMGALIYTGGRDGVMELVFKYADASGGKVVGVLPSNSDIANGHVIVNTGLDMIGRSIPLIKSVDIVVAMGGGSGTLVEMFMANSYGKPLFIPQGSGEWTDRLAEMLLTYKEDLLCRDGTYTLDSRRKNILCGVVVSSAIYSPIHPEKMASEILSFVHRFNRYT
jgi:uncharacterized protein (TIGR00725 family)